VLVIELARNFGTSGDQRRLDYARGRAVVIMDADLQDRPSAAQSSPSGARATTWCTPSASAQEAGPSALPMHLLPAAAAHRQHSIPLDSATFASWIARRGHSRQHAGAQPLCARHPQLVGLDRWVAV